VYVPSATVPSDFNPNFLQEIAQESAGKGSKAGTSIWDVTWTLDHLEAAMLDSIGRQPAKNPVTNAPWPAIKSLDDVLACRFDARHRLLSALIAAVLFGADA
jgi:hypothetical protein